MAVVKRCLSSDATRTFSLLLLVMQGRRTDGEETRRMGINLTRLKLAWLDQHTNLGGNEMDLSYRDLRRCPCEPCRARKRSSCWCE